MSGCQTIETLRPLTSRLAVAVTCGLYAASLAASDARMDEIVVRGRLLEQAEQDVAGSVSVIGETKVRAREATHFEELLNAVANVNFTAGASRGRFVQIRGIGEREQYVDPVDASVGLYVDGIDFSAIGNAGVLFDTAQVEVLRGPQGSAFGASAMAGMINIRSAAPTREFEAYLQGRIAGYGGIGAGAVLSGPLGQTLAARLALSRNRSDGYIRNRYLRRDDTNDTDESIARLRIDWQPREDIQVGVTLLHVDADNGYDAWSLDNDRHTWSDQPGRDRQQSDAVALQARWKRQRGFDVELLASRSSTDTDFGYDEDWSWPGICAGQACEGWEYTSTDRYLRDIEARALDLRLIGHGEESLRWVAGVHAEKRDTGLDRRYFDWSQFPPPPARFRSDYAARRTAVYGELEQDLGARFTLLSGIRLERFEADYDDSLRVRARPRETLWGGQISLQYHLAEEGMLYALVARGFKPAGVNGEARGKAAAAHIDAVPGNFDSETLLDYELGYKALLDEGRLSLRAAVFRMNRRDVQLKQWYTWIDVTPMFLGYTDNAARGRNIGLEFEANWRVREPLRVGMSLGWLDTRLGSYTANDPDLGLVRRTGREQAQAPQWQYNLDAELEFAPGWFAHVELEGKDNYYFSDSNDEKSDAFNLLHIACAYRGRRFEARAWLRNALDKKYAVHGFYFGNDPRKFYVNEPYYQFGQPRVAGLSLRYTL